MKLVVGLGNPGARYARTRHNVGFMVVDSLHQDDVRSTPYVSSCEGLVTRARVEREEVVLLKPQTFMNRSGRSVTQALEIYDLETEELLVVHDDLDLDYGSVRVKVGGGSGGHRGLESCFAELDTRDFARIRVGIGRPASGDATDYVLDEFDEEQRGMVSDVVSLAADAARMTLTAGAAAAMNRFNRRRVDGGEP